MYAGNNVKIAPYFFRKLQEKQGNFAIKVEDYHKWQVVKADDTFSTWLSNTQGAIFALARIPNPTGKYLEHLKEVRAKVESVSQCRKALDEISSGIKYIVWPITSDVKQYFVGEMFHLNEAKTLWTEIVAAIAGKPLAVIGKDDALMTKIHQCEYDITYIRNAVHKKCEDWRLAFPRLFLFHDDKLINFMEDFPHCAGLSEIFHFNSFHFFNENDIVGLVSEKGEELRLIHPVCVKKCCCCPSKILKEIECAMRESLKEEILDTLKTREVSREWYTSHLSQAVSIALWVEWTKNIQEAFKGKEVNQGLTNCLDLYKNELKLFAQFIRETKDPKMRPKADVIAGTLHNMNLILEEMIKKSVKTGTEPIWEDAVKMYWKNNTILVQSEDHIVEYGYEFYGPRSPLVVCLPSYINTRHLILGSFQHAMTAAIVGEPDVGKSSTIADMAVQMGKPMFRFVCREQSKMTDLENYFKASAYSAGIVCVEEMERMEAEKKWTENWTKMLEVRQAGCTEFVEEGKSIEIKSNFTAVGTLKVGYEKILNFVTVAKLDEPDKAVIFENVLYTSGFENARELAGKIMKCTQGFSDKFSKAHQYVFGVRFYKKMAHLMRHMEVKYGLNDEDAAVQSIHFLVKILLERGDYKTYDEVMKSVFAAKAEVKLINPSLGKVLAEAGCKFSDENIYKLVCMYELMECNMNLLVEAPNEQIIRILSDAVTKVYPSVMPVLSVVDLNLPIEDILGRHTNDLWENGILDKTIKSLDHKKISWVVLKGNANPTEEQMLSMFNDCGEYTSHGGFNIKLPAKARVISTEPKFDFLGQGVLSKFCVVKMA